MHAVFVLVLASLLHESLMQSLNSWVSLMRVSIVLILPPLCLFECICVTTP